jgi:hypothetical protein
MSPGTEGGARRRIDLTRAAAFTALVSSLVVLAFTLWPGLKPDPESTYRARVSVFAVEPGVRFGDYLHRLAFSPARYRERRDELLGGESRQDGPAVAAGLARLRGEVVYVRSVVEGFKRRSVQLRWSLYAVRTRRRLPDASFSDVAAASVDGDTPVDRTLQQIWIPPPPGPGPWFVRVGLYDRRETLLDVADSARFRGPR